MANNRTVGGYSVKQVELFVNALCHTFLDVYCPLWISYIVVCGIDSVGTLHFSLISQSFLQFINVSYITQRNHNTTQLLTKRVIQDEVTILKVFKRATSVTL